MTKVPFIYANPRTTKPLEPLHRSEKASATCTTRFILDLMKVVGNDGFNGDLPW